MTMSKKSKVFCIGLYKTGTMSIGRALIQLGYNVCPARVVREKRDVLAENAPTWEVFQAVQEISREYGAFRNNPWHRIYQECAFAYPGAKFILTVRKKETWLPSVLAHFSQEGRTLKSPMEYLDIYSAHERNVREYFASRPDRLLVLDIAQADWRTLCGFLNRRVPLLRSFPHRNQTALRGKPHIRKVLQYEFGEVARGVSQFVGSIAR